MRYYVLFNPMAGSGHGKEAAEKIRAFYPDDELFFRDVTEMGNLPAFLDALAKDDAVILCGGDGTLNHFVNDLDGYAPQNPILLYGVGTGNDFMNDRDLPHDAAPFAINEYLTDLPTVTVNGMTKRFLNGIGYGIDGYCCEVGDALRETSDKPINYTSIAIKGLLFHYKPDGFLGDLLFVQVPEPVFEQCVSPPPVEIPKSSNIIYPKGAACQ